MVGKIMKENGRRIIENLRLEDLPGLPKEPFAAANTVLVHAVITGKVSYLIN